MLSGKLSTMKLKCDQDNSQSRISAAQNGSLNTAELATEIGRTLAQIGDKINKDYFEEFNLQRDNITSKFVREAAKTLSVALICGWCDALC